MLIVRGKPTRMMFVPVDGQGAAISEGALLMPGVTATDSSAKNLSVAILADGAAANAIGILATKKLAASANDPVVNSGTGAVTKEPSSSSVGCSYPVDPLLPGCEVAIEYDQTSSGYLAVTSATSTVITITSLEDNIDGSWIYVVSGTGAGQLEYAVASASGSITVKSAMTTTLDNTSNIIILRRRFHALHTLSTDRTKLFTGAAAGSCTWVNLKNEIKYAGLEGWREPDPAFDHDKQFGTAQFAARSIFCPVNTLYNPI